MPEAVGHEPQKSSTFPASALREGVSMRRDTQTLVEAAFATVLGILSVPHPASAQFLFQPDIPVPPYNPYPALPGFTPPSILPPDIQPEIYRVRAEVNTIFGRYFDEWQA